MKNHEGMIAAVAYYPEHWSEDLWKNDIERMLEHGITMLRIGDFSWAKYEPREGEFRIAYYDHFLDLCRRYGMKVIFCTPTAAPPVWLTDTYPEVCNNDTQGHPYDGPRRHYNYNSPIYRKLCKRIVEKIAGHYSKFDCIVGWQVDNELNCDLSAFRSEPDNVAFRQYLKNKFGTLDTLNDALGTTFWSRTYSDWEQIHLHGPYVGNAGCPHIQLEEYRFFSESAISFCEMQVQVLRDHLPKDIFITTNGLFDSLDYNRLMECGLDFITYDSYPNFAFDLERPAHSLQGLRDRKWSWSLMWTRSVSKCFGIMEQQAGANGWTSRMQTPAPKPGQMRLWSLQSAAHGANMVSWFRWRTSPIGCEIYWHGLNDHSNRPNRRLCELKQITQDLKKLDEVAKAQYQARLAILHDYQNDWDANLDVWHGRVDRFSDDGWFTATQKTHTPCDFLYVRETTTLEEILKYDVLVWPHAAILEPHTAEILKKYTEAGGTLILGPRTGYKDQYGRCPMRPMPGLVSEWCGVTVDEYTLVNENVDTVKLHWGDKTFAAPVFNETLIPAEGTEVLANYGDSYYAGQAALCKKQVGDGTVYFLGCCFSEEIAEQLLTVSGIKEPFADILQLPQTVELAVRADDHWNYIFLLNYQDGEAQVTLNRPMRDLLSDELYDGTQSIPAYGVWVLKTEAHRTEP